jgi:hypothetical protein
MVNQTINRAGGVTPSWPPWLLWLAVIMTYILIVAGAVFLHLQTASRSGVDVFGWRPPPTAEFRLRCGIAIVCSLALAAIPNAFVLAKGRGKSRAMAVVSPLFVILSLVVAFNL